MLTVVVLKQHEHTNINTVFLGELSL